uniref:EAL domain-containing protein n=1 Tax=Aliarcobacter sp. TaxID=2321116 RepID=UPI0040476C1D
MNNKIFLKIVGLLVVPLTIYSIFIFFYLFPHINANLYEQEKNSIRNQFNKIASIISTQPIKNVEFLLDSKVFKESGYIYIFDSNSKIIYDPTKEYKKGENFTKKLSNNNLLASELKSAYKTNKELIYTFEENKENKKISFIEYNKELDWYIVSSVNERELSTFNYDLDSPLVMFSILLFIVLLIAEILIIIKIINPLNKLYKEVKDVTLDSGLLIQNNTKDEIGFISRQFNILINKIENNQKDLEEQVELKAKEIRDSFYFDSLTGLRNRYALEEDIKDDEFVSIVLVDIDSFDDINELYGFSTGNQVLIKTAEVLTDFSKKYNVDLYRVFGNVYCFADKKMMGFSKYDKFIGEICTIFKSEAIHIDEINSDIYINITLGVSIAQEEPFKTASIALKKAKKNNMKFFVYNNEIDTKDVIKKSMYWREKIKLAIEENNVVPFYQAIYGRESQIIKYETLMRIKDKNSEGDSIFLTPYLFLDVSVRTKQYLQLSNQIISKAISDLHKTQKQISINLSFKDILDTEFIDSLDEKLEDLSKENKSRIVFEILETDYISDYGLLEDFILKYRKQGIKIAIDDFGTGYSNFAHILKIRPDYIKIDGSLIKNINTDKNTYEMVKSIVDFSKALNIKTIAEFIHSKDVYDIAYDLGIDEFQGFYLAEPAENIQ